MTSTAPYPAFNGSEPCRSNPNAWTPKDEASQVAEYAKNRCGPCHVRDACLAWGLSNDEVGIYGGTTTAERQEITGRVRTIKQPLKSDTIGAVHQLQAEGFSISQTARELGIHMTTVSKYRSMSLS